MFALEFRGPSLNRPDFRLQSSIHIKKRGGKKEEEISFCLFKLYCLFLCLISWPSDINNGVPETSLKTTTKQSQIKIVGLAKLKNRCKGRPRTRKIIFNGFVRPKLSEYLVSLLRYLATGYLTVEYIIYVT